MKKKIKNNTGLIGILGVGLFGIGMVLSVVGLSKTVSEIDGAVVAREPEAILASSGVESGSDIELPVAFFDQRADECVNIYDLSANAILKNRQFEWSSCGYNIRQIEQGMVDYQLGSNYLPVGIGGSLISNRGIHDLSRWFNNVDGKSKQYLSEIKLNYTVGDTVEFLYNNEAFYPLDGVDFSNGDVINNDGHNHLFTMNMAVPFTVMADGKEAVEIVADDDTFVFIGDKLVIDMGGIHDAATGRLAINEAGEVYSGVGEGDLAYSGVNVAGGEGSIVRVFHADRDSMNSVFKIKLTGINMTVVKGQLASSNGVQVAYDPTDPGYIGPLGETMTVRPDMTKGYIVIATVMGVLILLCTVFASVMLRAVVKNKARKK